MNRGVARCCVALLAIGCVFASSSISRGQDSAPAAAATELAGRVVTARGEPIFGAVVEPFGGQTTERRWYGRVKMDAQALTDRDGVFRLRAREPMLAADVKVRAEGFAPRVFTSLSLGTTSHTLTLTPGVTVVGRLLKDGQPVPHVNVGLVQQSRATESFVGAQEATTDEEGRFRFEHVPPRERWFIYGIMSTLADIGALGPTPLNTTADGATVDAGDLAVGPAHRLAGVVVTADGGPLPAGMHVTVSPDEAWDRQSAEVLPDGAFNLAGLAPGVYSLNVRAAGYRLSAANHSLDPINPFRLIGRVDGDLTDLRVAIEPGRGPDEFRPSMEASGRSRRLRETRLAGLVDEPRDDAAAPANGATVRVAGRIVSAAGEPLPGVQIRAIAYTSERPDESRPHYFAWEMVRSGQFALQNEIAAFDKATTDESGAFRFDLPDARPIDLAFWGDSVPQTRRTGIERLPASERESLTLTVAEPGRIVGRVNRQTLPEISHLELRSATESGNAQQVRLKPEQDTFEFTAIAPGSYRLGVAGPRLSDARGRMFTTPLIAVAEVDVAAGQEHTIDFGFGPMPAVSGRVLFGERPMSGGYVVLTLRGEARSLQTMLVATTDEQGRFRYPHVAPGAYDLIPLGESRPFALNLRAMNLRQEVVVEGSNVERDFVFEPVATVRGRLAAPPVDLTLRRVEPEDAEPVSRSVMGMNIDAEGRFSFFGLPAGTYVLTQQQNRQFITLRRGIVVPAGVDVDLGTLSPEAGVVEVTVEGLLPNPDRPLHVEIHADGSRPDSLATQLASGAVVPGERTITFDSILPGPARVSAASGAYAMRGEPPRVAVMPGEAAKVTVHVEPLTWLTVGVADPARTLTAVTLQPADGGPAVELERQEDPPITARDAREYAFFTDRFARARGLSPGSWTITATLSDGQTWSHRVTLDPGVQTLVRVE